MKKGRPEEARMLLDMAVDLDQVIVLETESLRRPLRAGSELGMSLQRIEDQALQQADLMRDVENRLKRPRRKNDEAFLAGPPLPLDLSRAKRRPSSGADKGPSRA